MKKLERGVFVISLDTELAWGRINEKSLESFRPLIKNTRVAIKGILELFEKYQVPATWAFTGHLFHTNHAEAKKAGFAINDFYPDGLAVSRYQEDSLNSPENSTLFFGRDIYDSVISSSVPHEIASHAFSHILYGDSPEALVRKDLQFCENAAKGLGINLKSFVFPRNNLGKREILKECGYHVYRGEDQTCYSANPLPLKKLLRQIDDLWGFKPRVTLPEVDEYELINVPGHMLFRKAHIGWKKYVPFSRQVHKALKGLEAAMQEQKVFHLWFHPFNFGYQTEEHLEGLETVLHKAAVLREKNKLFIWTMKDFSQK